MEAREKIAFLLAGLSAGTLLGVLFAPKSGAETRDFIANKAGESKDYLLRQGEKIRDSAGDVVKKGKDLVSSQKERLADAIEAGRQAYREAVREPV